MLLPPAVLSVNIFFVVTSVKSARRREFIYKYITYHLCATKQVDDETEL